MPTPQGPLSGFRDMLAEQMLSRDEVLGKITSVYERYGFTPLKTPALERYEVLAGKYGDEGNQLMYHFEDQGGRQVALRYDLTVPLARVVAAYGPQLPSPYKRYAVGDVWRGESPQAGRYREFTQFDADIVGASSYLADAEILAMMMDAMQAVGAAVTIRVNDRRLFDGLAESCGISGQTDFLKLVTIIDKIDKIGRAAVLGEVAAVFGAEAGSLVKHYLAIEGDTAAKLDQAASLLTTQTAQDSIASLRQIFDVLAAAGYTSVIVFDQTIARGLNYYTGTVFETSLNDLPAIGSVCSGGRYDGLIESLGGPATPAVGTSVGVDRLMEGLRQLNLLNAKRTRTEVFVANLDSGLDEQRFALVQNLRSRGIAAEMFYEERKLGKQLQAAEKLGVNRVIIFGAQEAERGIAVVKDLTSGEQQELPLDELAGNLQ